MTLWSRTAFSIAAVFLVAACGSDTQSAPPDDPSNAADDPNPTVSTTVPAIPEDPVTDPSNGVDPIVTDPVASTPEPPASRIYEGDGYPPELTALIGLAINDLAGRLGVRTDSILVVTVEEVVWPNGGLGCPLPDMKYTQVPVDGLRIVLMHEGAEFEYHSGGFVEPILCLPESVKGAAGQTSDQGAPSGEYGESTEGTLELEIAVPPDESVPTEQPGGPGGQPND
jgi:hypothetical protein